MRPQSWAAPVQRISVLIFGPEPVGGFQGRSATVGAHRELTGRTGRGVRFGEKATPARRYYGDLGPLQTFRGALSSHNQTNLRGAGDGRAFPSTKPTVSAAQQSLEAAYGPYGSA